MDARRARVEALGLFDDSACASGPQTAVADGEICAVFELERPYRSAVATSRMYDGRLARASHRSDPMSAQLEIQP